MKKTWKVLLSVVILVAVVLGARAINDDRNNHLSTSKSSEAVADTTVLATASDIEEGDDTEDTIEDSQEQAKDESDKKTVTKKDASSDKTKSTTSNEKPVTSKEDNWSKSVSTKGTANKDNIKTSKNEKKKESLSNPSTNASNSASNKDSSSEATSNESSSQDTIKAPVQTKTPGKVETKKEEDNKKKETVYFRVVIPSEYKKGGVDATLVIDNTGGKYKYLSDWIRKSKGITVNGEKLNIGWEDTVVPSPDMTEMVESMYIRSILGVEANDSKELWWKLSVNGKLSDTGVDGVEMKSGTRIEFVFTKGFDFDF